MTRASWPLQKGRKTVPLGASPSGSVQRAATGFSRPLSGWWCALGWFAATAIFIGVVRLLHGPAHGDFSESALSTWTIAHGRLSCAYPPGITKDSPFVAPLYPLLSGGAAALARIGHTVPFPTPGALGPDCARAMTAVARWSDRSHAVDATIRLAYLSWLVFMAGLVALLRAAGRGRSRWEPAALVLMACVPPVFMSVQSDFHPQDLVAMGLTLGGLACALRCRWLWAGLLLGLAVTSQQFALLVLAPLLVLVPRSERVKFLGVAIGAAALVDVPMIAVTAGRAAGPVFLGSGNGPSYGMTVLSALHVQGALLVALSRVVPVLLSMALAWWLARRLGPAARQPLVLLSLVATSFAFRLVFEQNLFGYYFMAVAVALVVRDVVRGRVGITLLGWLALVTLAFDPLPWGRHPLDDVHPLWLFQVVLVPLAVALAVAPLLANVRSRDPASSVDQPLTSPP